MKSVVAVVIVFIGLVVSGANLTTKNGQLYRDYEVVSVDGRGVSIVHEQGITIIALNNWPDAKMKEIAGKLEEYRNNRGAVAKVQEPAKVNAPVKTTQTVQKSAQGKTTVKKISLKEAVRRYGFNSGSKFPITDESTFIGIKLGSHITEFPTASCHETSDASRIYFMFSLPADKAKLLPGISGTKTWNCELGVLESGQIFRVTTFLAAPPDDLEPEKILNCVQMVEKQYGQKIVDLPTRANGKKRIPLSEVFQNWNQYKNDDFESLGSIYNGKINMLFCLIRSGGKMHVSFSCDSIEGSYIYGYKVKEMEERAKKEVK